MMFSRVYCNNLYLYASFIICTYNHQFQMEVPACPVLHPTLEQFNDFYAYIHYLDKTYKREYGMVKIVPPPQWKPQAKDYLQRLENLTVKHPIQQNVQGRGGFYESKNIVQPKLSLKAYKKYAERESQKVASCSIAQKEKMFWKTITYSPPIYGADLTGTLMDQGAGEWNLNHLNSLLRYALTEKVKGVTEPYCYIGAWKAFFSWHKEDLDLSALNYIHEGASKFWYAIARDDGNILEEEARLHFKAQFEKCSQFLRHKTFLINPEVLKQRHPDMKITKVEHKAGQIMMVFGGAYHSGFNTGFNIAEAVNYATLDWIGQLLNINFCKCFKRCVKGQVQSILYNLQNSSLYNDLLTLDSFKELRYHVFEQQQKEGIYEIVPAELEPQIVLLGEVPKIEAHQYKKTAQKSQSGKKQEKHEEWKPKKSFKSKAKISLKIKKETRPHDSKKENGSSNNFRHQNGLKKNQGPQDRLKQEKQEKQQKSSLLLQKF